jgi:hypothetical protein
MVEMVEYDVVAWALKPLSHIEPEPPSLKGLCLKLFAAEWVPDHIRPLTTP